MLPNGVSLAFACFEVMGSDHAIVDEPGSPNDSLILEHHVIREAANDPCSVKPLIHFFNRTQHLQPR
jgi:hypothetical protein